MATIEDAVASLQIILTDDLPTQLDALMALYTDGIRLEPIRQFEWEEPHGKISSTPAALILGVEDSDVAGRDMVFDAVIILYVILVDRAKNQLTKKLFRYAEAVRRSLRSPQNRTLRATVISAKVSRVKYSPTYTDRTNLYMRDFEATITLRMPRGA
jgi:hypothetical protein